MVLVFGIAWTVVSMLLPIQAVTATYVMPYIVDMLEYIALAALCFGSASGLKTLQQINHRTAQQNAALRRMLSQNIPQPPIPNYATSTPRYPIPPPPSYKDLSTARRIDLAPHAPTNWNDYKPHPVVNIAHAKKLARRGRLGAVEDARDMFAERLKQKRKQNGKR